jgi:hypothetical protein
MPGQPANPVARFAFMEDLEFLDGYEGQTLDELLAMKSTHSVDSLILAIEMALTEKGKALEWELCEPEWVVLAVEAIEREVHSGGYLQFFSNSSRAYTGIADSALDLIGCPNVASITRDAISVLQLPDEFGMDDVAAALEERRNEITEALEDCDRRFFENEESIAECLLTFIDANKDEIQIPHN